MPTGLRPAKAKHIDEKAKANVNTRGHDAKAKAKGK